MMLPIGEPVWEPRGRGGLYSTQDPFYDDDWGPNSVPDRIKRLVARLAEAPQLRPYLEQFELFLGPTEKGLAWRCAHCRPELCSCGSNRMGTTRPRSSEVLVLCYNDPELRPIFDQLKLAVRQ